MRSAFEKILASIVIGLILPLVLFRFRVNPWSEALRYWLVFLLCCSIAFLVYKYRNPGNERISIRTHLINLLISFVLLCVTAVVYVLVLATLYAVV
jgi:hypothetical protein